MGATTEKSKFTKRMINFNTLEVRCPYHSADVEVMTEGFCFPHNEKFCEFYCTIDVGVVLCKWTEADGYAKK